jgi:hypothetical protein
VLWYGILGGVCLYRKSIHMPANSLSLPSGCVVQYRKFHDFFAVAVNLTLISQRTCDDLARRSTIMLPLPLYL